jgi:pyrroloquinoline quinone biosynthesis protein E
MVSYAHSKDIWVRTTTNATLLKTQNFYKKIIDAGIGEIQISVDGVTKDTYEKIRKGAQFEKVVENCNLINDYCNSKNLTKTRMWVLIQKDNFKELKSFPKFASKMGFKRLTFALDIHDWGTNNLVDVKRKQIVLSAKDICELIELGKRYNIDISIWQNQNAKYSNDNLCPWPFERFFIMSDKKILPCCMIGSSKVFSLGDLHKKTLKDIWFSKTYTVFRNRHLTNNIPEICKNCYVRSDN